MNKLASVFLAAILTAACPSFSAAEALPSKEAQAVTAKAAGWSSYKAAFVLDANEEDGTKFTLKGTLLYKKPNLRRLEIQEQGAEPATQLLVADGKTEWQYYPANNVVYRMDNPEELPGPHRPFADVKAKSVRFTGKVDGKEGPLMRFEAEPKPESVEGAPVPVKSVRLDVSEKDGLLREMALLDEKGNAVLTQSFSGVQVNASAPDKEFKFTVPEGVPVRELPPQPQAGQTQEE